MKEGRGFILQATSVDSKKARERLASLTANVLIPVIDKLRKAKHRMALLLKTVTEDVLAVRLPSSGGSVIFWLFLGQVKEFLNSGKGAEVGGGKGDAILI